MLYICVKYHENISDSIRVMKLTQMMEALTDTQNFGGYNIIPSPLFVAGHKKWKKCTLWHVPPLKTEICLHIRAVYASSQSTKRSNGLLSIHRVGSIFVCFTQVLRHFQQSFSCNVCLYVAGSSMLTFRVLPKWNITPQTHDMIFNPVTLYRHWVNLYWFLALLS